MEEINELQVYDVKTKVFEEAVGFTDFAIKVTVQNMREKRRDLYLVLQGLDIDGFEIASIEFYGELAAKQVKSVTDRRTIQTETYREIVYWQVKYSM